jgi:hypothetical protein
MAFLRFNRDKRGYEHFYLVEAATNRRGKTKTRVLYWFRTPPGVRVGREPFDESVRRALEAQNPGVTFDWRSILEAPIPSADTEKWRDRRRAERAAKQAIAALDAEVSLEDDAIEAGPAADAADGSNGDLPADDAPSVEISADTALAISNQLPEPAVDLARKRRRRRRGRRPGADAPSDAPSEPRDEGTGEESDDDPGLNASGADESVLRSEDSGSTSGEHDSQSGEHESQSGDAGLHSDESESRPDETGSRSDENGSRSGEHTKPSGD